ncbi:MAG: carbohydrate ABC transporter permease [Lachnospiraceae bacterium]|jgi:multiple sugar transport system permease protein|nr:carbohydrate ABC transporter permease [Lachnospiraceae bacterium]MCI8873353.1 carbohydrate ABC transporter permease [Lachnospiraceae bacterium]GFI29134.1 L-arabinose transport system permease protein AraQ [Lachnospiraceae bacterium]
MKKKRRFGFYLTVAVLAVGAFFMALPLYWMAVSSFKGQSELLQMPPTMYPHEWVFSNFSRVLESIPFLRYYANSLATSAINTAAGVLTSAILGFVFAKYRFKGRDAIFLCILAFMMIPYDTLMIPLYKLMAGMKLTNSYFVLTVPYFINIFGIFLMRQFYLDLADDYLEAAEMDGCGHFKRFFTIALPMAKPMMSALFIYLFMASYNSYLWPLISVSKRNLFTLTVGIGAFFSDRGTQTDLIMAASAMMIVPIVVIFCLAQRNFVEGLTVGGVKG